MTTYIKTLKEDNGDIVYPQTITDAIYTSGGQTLETEISKYVTAEDIASSVTSFGTVTTGMIADGAITAAKIDWTTLGIQQVGLPSATALTVSSTTPTKILELTANNTGKFLVVAIGSTYGSDNTLFRYVLGKNNSYDANRMFIIDSGRHCFSITNVYDLTAGDTVQLFACGQTDGTMRPDSRLFIVRIG